VAYDWDKHENSAEQPAPKTAPEGAALAPEFNSIACVIEPYDMLIGVKPLTDNAKVLDVNSSVGQLLDCNLRRLMIVEDGDHGVEFCHLMIPLNGDTILESLPMSN
jgi:hypothetical protein